MDLQEQNRLDIRGMEDMSAVEEQIQRPFPAEKRTCTYLL